MKNSDTSTINEALVVIDEPSIELVSLSVDGSNCQPSCSPACGPCSPCNPDMCHPDCSPYD